MKVPFRFIGYSFLITLIGAVNAAPDASLYEGLRAREIGPAAVSGRIAAIDVVAVNPNRIIIGAATGGVWISNNGGLNWEPVFEDQPVASIGALAINQDNPDIIWVGTGESNVRNSTSVGAGIYKSIDGGKTWSLSGLANSERIDRIALHPHDPDTAYVAALGTLWGPNAERGVYKTVDGGETWQRILYVDETTGATDIKMDPANPNKLYAAMWQFRRWPYQFKSGGPGSGIYISKDAGKTWQQRAEEDGLPAGELGRTVFGISPAEPKRIYALIEAEKSALLVSADGGDKWEKVNEEYNVSDRPFYYSEITVDPNDANHVFNIATFIRESIDGGKTFTQNPLIACCESSNTVHIDSHAFWINPADSDHMIVGNDGGIAITRDRGVTWRYVRNLPLSQFYHIAVDNDHPYHVYGGLQDNGSWRGPAEVWENAGIRNLHWQEVGFGDGFDTLPMPDDSSSGYVMSQGGYLSRWNLTTGEQRLIKPDPPSSDIELRFNWNSGIAIDPFDANTVYYGSQFLHKSSDRGASWTTISGDLTSNNPEVQLYKESGGLTYDVTAAENYTTIFAVAPSKLEQGLIWVGTDDGRVHITRNGGEDWQRVNERVRGLPDGAWAAMITPSPHDAGTAFMAFDDHRRGNMNTYLFKVENYGQRWTSLSTAEISGYALSVLQDVKDPDLLFAGTEFGLYVSSDGGKGWFKFTAGVPTVSVMDMAIQERESDLVLGTHGRSIFVIDDFSALRNLNDEDFSARFKMLSATDGQHYVAAQTPSTRFTGSGEYRASNEPYGVMLTFMANGKDLKHPDPDRDRERAIEQRKNSKTADLTDDDSEIVIKIEVRDSLGAVVRNFEATPTQGINRITWGMTHDGVRAFPSDEPPESDVLPEGVEVPPGKYKVTMTLVGATEEVEPITSDVMTIKDPRSSFSQADIELQYKTMLDLQGLQERAVQLVEKIVRARADIDTIKKLIEQRGDGGVNNLTSLTEDADKVIEQLNELESLIRVPDQTKGFVYSDDKMIAHIEMAQYYVGSSRDAPSAAANSYVDTATRETASVSSIVSAYFENEFTAFRDSVRAAGIGLLNQ